MAADADPDTGYAVRVDGQDTVVGGTSAVAPLWAGLIARLNQALGKPVGFLNPTLYGLDSAERRLPRHHQRQQRCVLRRTGLGRLQRAGRRRRHQAARRAIAVIAPLPGCRAPA